MPALTIVVPCYNESERLDERAFGELAAGEGVRVVAADDGSRDQTRARLQDIASRWPHAVTVRGQNRNAGKAETVRAAMLEALRGGADAVGYLDADMSTSPAELHRLWATLRERDVDMVMASRVAMLGTRIERKPSRHYVGRIFATAASRILGLPVYDTQCGAKIMRATPALEAALSEPFISRWAFDVELLGRLVIGAPGVPPIPVDRIVEVPLRAWVDVPGSKLHLSGMIKAAWDLVRVARNLSKRRRALPRQKTI